MTLTPMMRKVPKTDTQNSLMPRAAMLASQPGRESLHVD